MSDHDTACTCDRCRMMVMPTTRTVSERVLHEWVDDKGRTWHLKNIPHRDAIIPWAYRYGPDGSCESSDGGACVDELARLAAENAKATVKDYLTVQAERDRLCEDRRTLSLDELVYGTRAMHEVVELRAERDRLKVELGEAEEAIRDLTDSGDAMRFSMPTAAMAGKAGWDASRRHAAVRRALERGGRG